jgi:hypothetical protein
MEHWQDFARYPGFVFFVADEKIPRATATVITGLS